MASDSPTGLATERETPSQKLRQASVSDPTRSAFMTLIIAKPPPTPRIRLISRKLILQLQSYNFAIKRFTPAYNIISTQTIYSRKRSKREKRGSTPGSSNTPGPSTTSNEIPATKPKGLDSVTVVSTDLNQVIGRFSGPSGDIKGGLGQIKLVGEQPYTFDVIQRTSTKGRIVYDFQLTQKVEKKLNTVLLFRWSRSKSTSPLWELRAIKPESKNAFAWLDKDGIHVKNDFSTVLPESDDYTLAPSKQINVIMLTGLWVLLIERESLLKWGPEPSDPTVNVSKQASYFEPSPTSEEKDTWLEESSKNDLSKTKIWRRLSIGKKKDEAETGLETNLTDGRADKINADQKSAEQKQKKEIKETKETKKELKKEGKKETKESKKEGKKETKNGTKTDDKTTSATPLVTSLSFAGIFGGESKRKNSHVSFEA